MARRTRSSLETRTNRLKLPIRKKPYSVLIAPNIHLCYRRNEGPGSWSVRQNGADGWLKRFSLADDHETGNNDTIMSYWEALERAKSIARTGEGNGAERPITVAEAVDAYAADLKLHGGHRANVLHLQRHIPERLMSQPVALVTRKDWTTWRASLAGTLKLGTIDRITHSLKAMLNLAADNDRRLNREEWRIPALRKSDDAEPVRAEFLLSDSAVAALVHGAYEADRRNVGFGAFIHVLAETGARECQVRKLMPGDLKDEDAAAPRLMMPPSRKGRTRTKDRSAEHRPVSISPRLAAVLRRRIASRPPHAPLFDKMTKLSVRLRKVVKRLGLNPVIVPYAFRHSSITRALSRGVPVRVCAAMHDSSIKMIESVYSRYILDTTDVLTRGALVDIGEPVVGKVVPLVR
jgi:integrase